MTGIILFLIGFYCGRLWETRLKGKIISISLKTLFVVAFILLVIFLSYTALNKSKTGADIRFMDKEGELIDPDVTPQEK